MEGIQQTTELEFNQAMQDFKTMFPTMDVDVIEVIVPSSNFFKTFISTLVNLYLKRVLVVFRRHSRPICNINFRSM